MATRSQVKPVRRIATGGMAEVLLAVQRAAGGMSRLVVVKRILSHLSDDGALVQMFLDEARLGAALRHPNVVNVLDVRRDEGGFGMVMEYLSGEDLRYIIRSERDGRLEIPIPFVCHIVSEAANGLDYAHRAAGTSGEPMDVVHRDVSPGNIIVTYEGTVKLIDFGVAKANLHGAYTQPGVLKGKYAYASPESISGGSIDRRSDVFSLGILLHELLTGQRLFKGESTAAVIRSVLDDPIVAPSQVNPRVPPGLDQLVLSMLDRRPDGRPQWASEVREQLHAVLSHSGVQMTPSKLGRLMTTGLAQRFAERCHYEREALRDESEPLDIRRLPALFSSRPRTGESDPQVSRSPRPGLRGRRVGEGLHAKRRSGSSSAQQRRSRENRTSWRRRFVVSVALMAVFILLAYAVYWLGRWTSDVPQRPTPAHVD